MADGCQHGKSEHDQRDMPVPSVPGAGLVMVEAEFVLGGLETVLDGPTVAFDPDQCFNPGSSGAPGSKESQLAITDVPTDQQAARPRAGQVVAILGGVQVCQFQIGPVMQTGAFGALATGQAPPVAGFQPLGDAARRAAHRPGLVPGTEPVIGVDAQHIALALAAQQHLQVANAIDAVGRNPAERRARRHGALDHRHGQRRLGGKARPIWNMRRRQPIRVIRPDLGQVQRPVDESMAVPRHVAGEHANLTVRDLARRTRILPCHSARCLALLQKTRLVDHQHRIIVRQRFQRIIPHDIP